MSNSATSTVPARRWTWTQAGSVAELRAIGSKAPLAMVYARFGSEVWAVTVPGVSVPDQDCPRKAKALADAVVACRDAGLIVANR